MTDRVHTGSMLFAVRVWPEETTAGLEYRGSAREVVSGAFCSFRRWSELTSFIAARMDDVTDARSGRTEGGA